MPNTLSPCRSRRDASEKPMNPAAPVTSTVIALRPLAVDTLSTLILRLVGENIVAVNARRSGSQRSRRLATSPPHRLVVKIRIERLETPFHPLEIVILGNMRA